MPDPVYFHKDLRVTLQQIGGDSKRNVLKMLSQGVNVRPVSIANKSQFERLLDLPPGFDLSRSSTPDEAWVNIYERQDVSAVAFFYLDAPRNGLAPLASPERRRDALQGPAPASR